MYIFIQHPSSHYLPIPNSFAFALHQLSSSLLIACASMLTPATSDARRFPYEQVAHCFK